jgi:preprotein translocase subunit YajC
MDSHVIVGEAVPGGAGGGMTQLLIFGLIFLGMWFLMIAPNRKKQKLHQQMLLSLRSGDRVLLASGIFGKIVGIKGINCSVEIARGVRVDVLRSCVQRRLESGEVEMDDGDEGGEPDNDTPKSSRVIKNKPSRK